MPAAAPCVAPQIAIDELNAAGGVLGGKQIELVKADTGEDVTEGIKAYEYLAETENVDFIISGSIDDVSLGWLPRMAEYKIPTLDTWTSSIRHHRQAGRGLRQVQDVLHERRLRRSAGDAVCRFRQGHSGQEDGMEEDRHPPGGHRVRQCDQRAGDRSCWRPKPASRWSTRSSTTRATVDFSPIFSKAVDSGADFIYLISSVNSQVVSSQYVKLQVPMAMTGVNGRPLSARNTGRIPAAPAAASRR